MSKVDESHLLLQKMGFTEAGPVRRVKDGRLFTKFTKKGSDHHFINSRGSIYVGKNVDDAVMTEIPFQVTVHDSAITKFDHQIEMDSARIAQHFSSVIRGRMKELKMTVDDLAYTLGENHSCVERFLNPRVDLTIHEMVRLLAAVELKVSIAVRSAHA